MEEAGLPTTTVFTEDPVFIWTLEDLRNVRKCCKGREFDLRVVDSTGKVWLMHKDLLEASSPYLNELLDNVPVDNGLSTLKLTCAPNGMIELILNFLYEELLPHNLDLETTLKLMETSVSYSIIGLKDVAGVHAGQLITQEVVFKVLERARLVECEKLQESALQFIVANVDELVTTEEFLNLNCWDISRILSSDDLAWTETRVLDTAIEWAKKRVSSCEHEDPTLALTSYLAQLISCVRFPIMSNSDLVTATLNLDVQYAMEPQDFIQLLQHALLPPTEKCKVPVPSQFLKRPRKFSLNPTTFLEMISESQARLDSVLSNPSSRKRNSDGMEESINLTEAPKPVPTKVQRVSDPNEEVNPGPQTMLSRLHPPKTSPAKVNTDDKLDPTPPPNPPEAGTSSQNGGMDTSAPSAAEKDNDSSDDSEDEMIRVITVKDKEFPTFEVLSRRYLTDKTSDIASVEISNVELRNNYYSTQLQDYTREIVNAHCKFLNTDSLPQFVSYFNPMRYILLNSEKEKLKMNPEHIWSLDRDEIMLKFNGITFLRVQHSKKKGGNLTLNYVRDSLQILSNPKLEPSQLALSNCEFSTKGFIKNAKGEELPVEKMEKLVLYRVWGLYKLEDILKRFPKLKELKIWKFAPDDAEEDLCIPLFLDLSLKFTAFQHIRKLNLQGTLLIFPEKGAKPARSVTELVLDQCFSEDKKGTISKIFPVVFPNIERLVITEQSAGTLATPGLITSVIKKIKTLSWIMVDGMKWNEGSVEENEELLAFLKESNVGGVEFPEEIEMEKVGAKKWKGKTIDLDAGGEQEEQVSRDMLEYQWWDVNYFYDSLEVYQEYFLQDNFPRQLFWI